MKKALLIGASGFIGSHLLSDLLESPDYQQVTVVVRKPLAIKQAKLKMLIGDLHSLPSLKQDLVADDVFLTIGTTRKLTPDPNEYFRIDHDYPILAAKLAKENGASSVFVVTAVGANAGSSFFYVRLKGEIERDLIALDFKHTHLFQPSMILGNRQESRPFESGLIKIWSGLNSLMMGGLDQYRGIDGKEIARAMINAAKNQNAKVKFYRWREMQQEINRPPAPI